MMGWSMMINLISVILVYMYVPPVNSGLPPLITQAAIFGVVNVIALITAGSRLVDAVYDPLIAQFSDKSKNPQGRRIPIMKWSVLPSAVFCFFVFYPLTHTESNTNIYWLTLTLIGFYVSSTTYIIPYNALLPELAHDSEAKVRLSSWQSVGYVMGIGVASNSFNLIDVFQKQLSTNRLEALQVTVLVMIVLAAIFMAVTVFAIDEKKYCSGKPNAISIRKALKQTLGNRNFRFFIVADVSFFLSVTIITSGLIYFITVLLQLPDSIGNKLMITMVGVSFVCYPLVNRLSRNTKKKYIVVGALLLLSVSFLGLYFLGKPSIAPEAQIYSIIILTGIPLAALNILPNAILAEIIHEDTRATGENKEAIYFAVRYFFVKLAQTLGIGLFSMLLLYGKDVGHDLGIRLNGLLGFGLCIFAGIVFSRFKEEK